MLEKWALFMWGLQDFNCLTSWRQHGSAHVMRELNACARVHASEGRDGSENLISAHAALTSSSSISLGR